MSNYLSCVSSVFHSPMEPMKLGERRENFLAMFDPSGCGKVAAVVVVAMKAVMVDGDFATLVVEVTVEMVGRLWFAIQE